VILVLHLAVDGDGFALWGETEARRTAFSALAEALDRAGVSLGGKQRRMTAWLPSVDKHPVPSSPMLGEITDKTATITPWTVDALSIDTAAAMDLLADAVGKRLLAPGVLVGADLAFFATAMRFAAVLVTRGHVLPSLEQRGKAWRARWALAPAAAEHEQIASLARAMPPSAVALGMDAEGAPAVDRRAVVERFLGDVADRLMRREQSVKTGGTSLHDRWLAALFTEDGALGGDAAELQALAQTVAEWRRPVVEQSLFDFRVAFRLEEPPPDGEVGDTHDVWTIRLLLQSIEDPSLLVPLEAIWNSGQRGEEAADVRRLLRRGGGEAKRFILSSLAHAASLSRSVDALLRQPMPSEITTDTNGAFAFLSSDAAALESAGFGVFLPSWWSRRGTKKRLSLRGEARAPKFKSKGALSMESLVEVRWRVALGDEVLSMEELQSLARMKVSLVRLRGQWVQLRADEIEEAIRFARAKAAKVTLGEVVRLDLSGTAPGASALEVTGVSAEGEVATLLERVTGKRDWEELPPPEGFAGTLRPYQARGYSWLDFLSTTGFGACLADDMGLGKTVQTLALIQRQWLEARGPVLLICPTSVTGNWVREAARFTPELPLLLHHGSDRERGEAFVARAEQSGLVISSYSLLARDVETLQHVPWKGVVLDEAQNVKNSETKQARAARAIAAGFRVALTGTPVENNIGDLWSIIDFLNPGYLGSASSFRQRFFLPIQTQRDPNAIEQLRRLTGPFILRRLKTDKSIIADLPEKNEMKVYCTLTKEQASLYQAVVKEAEDAIAETEGINRKGLILATLTKLKQVCNHPRQLLGDASPIDGRSGKLARLTEMLGEAVSAGDGSLVFTQFAEMGTILQTHLQEQLGVEAMFLHGGTARAKRDQMVERFQSTDAGRPPIFILSLKAGGTGLNLTRANHVFHFDRWWNPAVENQATDRAFRIGQTRSVQVHKFICGGTFEEKIDAMIEGKLELAAKVVGTGEGWLTELSTTELSELFALRADAIGE
jgi:hypothetical protein